jgi:hypothetical protein
MQTAVVKQDLPSSVFKIANATMAAAALIHVRLCCIRLPPATMFCIMYKGNRPQSVFHICCR